MTDLPTRINAMRVVTYDVAGIVTEMCNPETGYIDGRTQTIPTPEEVTIDMVIDYIQTWMEGDFGCQYGHTSDISDLILQDENGEEL